MKNGNKIRNFKICASFLKSLLTNLIFSGFSTALVVQASKGYNQFIMLNQVFTTFPENITIKYRFLFKTCSFVTFADGNVPLQTGTEESLLLLGSYQCSDAGTAMLGN